MAERSLAEVGGVRLGTVYAAHGASHGFVLVLPAVLVALRAEFGASFTTLGTIAAGATPAPRSGRKTGSAHLPKQLRAFARRDLMSQASQGGGGAAPVWWLLRPVSS